MLFSNKSRTTTVSSIGSPDHDRDEKGMRKEWTKLATTTVRKLDLRIPFAASVRACVRIMPMHLAEGHVSPLSH